MELQITFATLAEYNEALDFFNSDNSAYIPDGIECQKSRRLGFLVYSQQEADNLEQQICDEFAAYTEIENFNFNIEDE